MVTAGRDGGVGRRRWWRPVMVTAGRGWRKIGDWPAGPPRGPEISVSGMVVTMARWRRREWPWPAQDGGRWAVAGGEGQGRPDPERNAIGQARVSDRVSKRPESG